jgi:hypothetical protein
LRRGPAAAQSTDRPLAPARRRRLRPAGAFVELDFDGLRGGQRPLRFGDGPAGPPLEILHPAGTVSLQPALGQIGLSFGRRYRSERLSKPRSHRRPPVQAARPTALWTAANDACFRRQQEQHTRRDADRPGPLLALPERDLDAQAGDPLGQLAGRSFAQFVECGHRFCFDLVEPRFDVAIDDVGRADEVNRSPSLPGGDGCGCRRVDDGGEVARHDEHRSAHAQDLEHAAVDIERLLDIARLEADDPSAQREVDGSWVGGMDAHLVAGGDSRVRGGTVRRQVVPRRQPSPPLGSVDFAHTPIVAAFADFPPGAYRRARRLASLSLAIVSASEAAAGDAGAGAFALGRGAGSLGAVAAVAEAGAAAVGACAVAAGAGALPA